MSDVKADNDVAQHESESVLQATEQASVSIAENNKAEEKQKPLEPNEFRSVLERINALGLTWTADVPPLIKPQTGVSRDALLNEEYLQIKRDYPTFPRELSSIVFFTLTGSKNIGWALGSPEDLEQKVATVKELVINAEYRSEFFFKYAIKVPYFSDLDWEVVIKTHEKNVNQKPRIAYALLSLIIRQPVNPTLPANLAEEFAETEMLTVAVDEHLVDKLINSLSEVKRALKESRLIADSLSSESTIEENENGVDS